MTRMRKMSARRRAFRHETEARLAVTGVANGFPPVLVIEIPAHGLLDSGLEIVPRAPAEFAFDLGGIDRIAAIVTGTVLHEGDEVAMPRAVMRIFVEQVADDVYDMQVRALVASADI